MSRNTVILVTLLVTLIVMVGAGFEFRFVLSTPKQSEIGRPATALDVTDASPWIPEAIPIEGFEISSHQLRSLIERATAWSRVKWGPSIDEHFLRLRPWLTEQGVDASSEALRRLTDGVEYRRQFGITPLLLDSPFGATFRSRGPASTPDSTRGDDSVGHVDAVLAAMAEAGFPLTSPLHTERHSYRLADVLEDSLMRADPRREAEWSLVAYCAYLGRQREWTNAREDQMHVSDLLRGVLARPRGSGPCRGVHQVWAIAWAWRKSRTVDCFDPTLIANTQRWLSVTRELCLRNQRVDGAWDPSWFSDTLNPSETTTQLQSRLDRVSTTGHLLEAFALLPDDLRPADESLTGALQYLLDEFGDDPDLFFSKDFSGATHAVRALCLFTTAARGATLDTQVESRVRQ